MFMPTTIRHTPTLAERVALKDNPHLAFGFFIKTDKPADAQVSTDFAIVTEPSFKLLGGYGLHLIATASGMRAVFEDLAAKGNRVTQNLLLRNGDNTVPAYSNFVAASQIRPVPNVALSVD